MMMYLAKPTKYVNRPSALATQKAATIFYPSGFLGINSPLESGVGPGSRLFGNVNQPQAQGCNEKERFAT